jgi:hypothetical protein
MYAFQGGDNNGPTAAAAPPPVAEFGDQYEEISMVARHAQKQREQQAMSSNSVC